MNKIDVCIISPGLLETNTNRGGGCEVNDYNVALFLSKKYNVVIISPYYNVYEQIKVINKNFSVTQIPISAWKQYPPIHLSEVFISILISWFSSIFIFIHILKFYKMGLKVIILHNPQTALISVIFAKFLKIRCIYSEGNITPWANPYIVPIKRSIIKKIWGSIDLFLSILLGHLVDSIRVQSDLISSGMIKNSINPKKINIIPAFIDLNKFFAIGKKESEYGKNNQVGFIGRLTEEKGIYLLERVIKLAHIENPNIRFLIFGDGPKKSKIQGYPNIMYIGKIPQDKLNNCLSKLDLAIFFQNDLGRAEIEAMAAGIPIIVPKTNDKIIIHEKTGYLCDLTANDYLRGINFLLSKPKLSKNISNNAKYFVQTHYNSERLELVWIAYCEKYINNNHAHGD